MAHENRTHYTNADAARSEYREEEEESYRMSERKEKGADRKGRTGKIEDDILETLREKGESWRERREKRRGRRNEEIGTIDLQR